MTQELDAAHRHADKDEELQDPDLDGEVTLDPGVGMAAPILLELWHAVEEQDAHQHGPERVVDRLERQTELRPLREQTPDQHIRPRQPPAAQSRGQL